MGLGSGLAKGDQNVQNMPSLWHHLQKTPTKNEKNFFSMSTWRLAESVEGLNSSLALAAGDLWPKKGRPITAVKGLIWWYLQNSARKKCKIPRNLTFISGELSWSFFKLTFNQSCGVGAGRIFNLRSRSRRKF